MFAYPFCGTFFLLPDAFFWVQQRRCAENGIDNTNKNGYIFLIQKHVLRIIFSARSVYCTLPIARECMRVALAQLNPMVGDFAGNREKMIQAFLHARKKKADLVVYSEMILTGYPPKDLLQDRDFITRAVEAQEELVRFTASHSGPAILFGNISLTGKRSGKGLYNTAALVQEGRLLFQQHKMLLPSYDVFDESRYFDAAPSQEIFSFMNEKLGITLCEDAWADPDLFPGRTYSVNPIAMLSSLGATLFINLSASPFSMGKEWLRYRLFRKHAGTTGRPFIMVNQTGGNDELIFDGRSMVFRAEDLIALLPNFREETRTVDIPHAEPVQYMPQETVSAVYEALSAGLSDYMRKCGFRQAVLGLSGGMDSALVCCLAVDALGPENVLAVSMPSPFTSRASIEDAALLAQNLRVQVKTIPITPIYRTTLEAMAPHFKGKSADVTEENIQARIRGQILMAFSNKFGYLTLSTGNKSELSVGYCTLYGDMSGGLSVLADVPKTLVYKLSRYRNSIGEAIPENIFTKPPSAELKENQTDQDTLPPYEALDRILHMHLDGCSRESIVAEGLPPDTVDWVIQAVAKNEYKRRQAPPGLKISEKAFGTGRRMPIAAKME